MQIVIYDENNEIKLIVNDVKDVAIFSDGVAISSCCSQNLYGETCRCLTIKEE